MNKSIANAIAAHGTKIEIANLIQLEFTVVIRFAPSCFRDVMRNNLDPSPFQLVGKRSGQNTRMPDHGLRSINETCSQEISKLKAVFKTLLCHLKLE